MSKNGTLSKLLLEDENFKTELKRILEESGIPVTDAEIPEVIKKFETVLQDDNALKEAELEVVSGGKMTKSEKIKLGATLAGDILGYALGEAYVLCVLNGKIKNSDFVKKAEANSVKSKTSFIIAKAAPWAGTALSSITTLIGSVIGSKVGDLIAKRVSDK